MNESYPLHIWVLTFESNHNLGYKSVACLVLGPGERRDPNYASSYTHKVHWLVVMSLTIVKCSECAYCLRHDTLLKPQILYRKNCTQSTQCCISRYSKTA